MKKVLIVFSAVMLLSSFGVAFADGDAANLFKTHCQGCHGADGGRVPASGIEPIKGQSAADLLKKLEGYTAPLAPNASWSWKTSSSSFRTSS